jgi:hypothetical protein
MTVQSQPRSIGIGQITACAGFVLAVLLAGSWDAQALPVFARKYHTSCATRFRSSAISISSNSSRKVIC